MRPHRLRVTAFGAFAGTEEVRFDELDGLFLLHGETGAGKTTLLDAIAFALYGRVPGERGKAKRLRSDHAAPDVRTEVELELTVGGRRLRIIRAPEWERPKKSGTGTTKVQSSVQLDEAAASGDWSNISVRVSEADAEILDLMGMSAEQFFQVALLPQGQFAQFLHADAEARRKLLEKLFGTDRFRAVEDWLAERRRTTQGDVAAADAQLGQLLARVAQVAGVPTVDEPGTSSEPGGAPWQVAWASGLLVTARERQEAAAGLAAAREAELDAALAELAAANELADRQRRRAEALRRQAALQAAEASVAVLRTELDGASRAAEVAPVLDEASRASDAASTAREAADRARAGVPAALALASSEELRAGAAEHRSRLGHLEALRAVAQQAELEDQVASRAQARVADIEAALSESRGEAEQLHGQRPGSRDARDAASQAQAGLAAARGEAETARRVATDLGALVREGAARARVAEDHRVAAAEALALNREYERIRRARIDGMSGELARNLVDGSPCPVCGSPDHPEPSEMPATWVSPDEEKQAYELAGEAASKAEKASQKVAAADAVITDVTERLAEAGTTVTADPVALAADAKRAEAEAERLEAAARQLQAAAAGLDRLQQELEDLDRGLAAAEKKQAELTEQRTAALEQAAGATQRAAEQRETLRAQLGDASDLESALAETRRLADVQEVAAEAADDAARAGETADQAAVRAVRAAESAGFGGPEEARAAVRDAELRTSAAERIRQHEGELKAVASLLADAELDVQLEPAPVEARQHSVAEARARHSAAVDALGRAQEASTQLSALQPRLASALTELSPLLDKAAEAKRLADLAAGLGANQYKMTLSAFVLAARLEEVAAAASQRLLTMTAGRYSLVHTDARRGSGRAGLGLLACDSWTGQDRDTSTLSGGETFMASLALALGLADVVTAEAAGTPMEALFVDEGFGSLDEETLEEVMTVLDGLREGGRMVGIVSHVSELRQRIPAQVYVRKSHHGSRVVVAAG